MLLYAHRNTDYSQAVLLFALLTLQALIPTLIFALILILSFYPNFDPDYAQLSLSGGLRANVIWCNT